MLFLDRISRMLTFVTNGQNRSQQSQNDQKVKKSRKCYENQQFCLTRTCIYQKIFYIWIIYSDTIKCCSFSEFRGCLLSSQMVKIGIMNTILTPKKSKNAPKSTFRRNRSSDLFRKIILCQKNMFPKTY